MPYAKTPSEQALPPLAARKLLAAERRERQAAHLRAEAADLVRRWTDYVATRDAEAQS